LTPRGVFASAADAVAAAASVAAPCICHCVRAGYSGASLHRISLFNFSRNFISARFVLQINIC